MKKIYILIGSLGLLVVDLISKAWIQTNLAVGESIVVIDNFFELTYVKNTGAAWGMMDASWMRPIFLLISVVVAVYCLYYFLKEDHLLALTSIALVMAGNLGNFYDRLTLEFVRDMFSFNLFGYPFPVFNVADMCLVIGFGLLMLYVYLEERKVK